MAEIVLEKLRRLRAGEAARTLDLFSGCGGLSLGTQLAGAVVLGGVEIDPAAARTHARNFHSAQDPCSAHALPRDITSQDPLSLVAELTGNAHPRSLVDLLVGGPPCQAFARVGRAKLREVIEHPEAFLHDSRAGLYRHYLRYVEALMPVAIVVENVPDVLNYGGTNIFELMSLAFEKLGYESRYTLLNAGHYGVPQMRDRCFLIAIRREVDSAPSFPTPSHAHKLPIGYRGTRDVALQTINMFEGRHYREAPTPPAGADPAVTAREAISDLPRITAHLGGNGRKRPQRLDEPMSTPEPPGLSSFARNMREWPGFPNSGVVFDHVTRHLPRDYRIFARMREGDQYPEAHAIARTLRDRAARAIERRTRRVVAPGSAAYRDLTKHYVPPYDPGKFPNKWRKMEADAPARTLMAHIGKDTYSHIHYDSTQARTISVREAARLQSFPDGFRFCGTMNPAFRQIGNSVPPLLASPIVHQLLLDLAHSTAGTSPGSSCESQPRIRWSTRGTHRRKAADAI
jgi:DNA (cytosine-5)-methyltransferase 1